MRIALIITVGLLLSSIARGEDMNSITLPRPKLKGDVSVEEAIQKRRSVRSYAHKMVGMEDISQILWAAQGITNERGALRASPSAGALYPLEVYLATGDGLFLYKPRTHSLQMIGKDNIKTALADAALGQKFVEEAAIDVIICAVYERVTAKYGKRGIRYTDMEAGHAAENVALQAVALGAFDDSEVARLLKLSPDQAPLYILPVGYKK